MKKKRYIANIIIILLFGIGILIIYGKSSMAKDNKSLTFYLPRSTSYASNWNYEISDKRIIKETASEIFDSWYYKYDYLEFEPGQSGEVTIYFIAQYETQVVEENCFFITYYVDENGNITEISSESKPDKVNFDDDIAGLVWLKTVDFLTKYIDGKISFIIDAEYMRLFRSN